MLVSVFSFFVGAILAWSVTSLIHAKKDSQNKEELIKLRAMSETSESLKEIIKKDFVLLANETIKNEQEDLRKQNKETLDEKITPLTKMLNDFREKIEQFNNKGTENTTRLVTELNNLKENNTVLKQQAENLVNALTKNQNVKGSYGEDLLDTILQSCGMQEGIHYSKQFVTTSINSKDEEIHSVRPDVVINLPDNRHLIIDSKVTLTSYIEYIEDDSKINEFKSKVKDRIKDLGNKNYQNAGDIFQPDFVLMYIPVEPSVNLLYQDTDLIQQAYKANIIIVGTSSLLTTIRLVCQLFAQQKQNESVQQIVTAGTNLYETFVQFCDELVEIQSKMNGVSSAFTTVINRFKRGNKNKPSLFSQVEALKNYGINTKKEIPTALLEEIEEGEIQNV